MLKIDLIQDHAGFERLKPEWDALLAASESDCFFLTWEWLFTWWKHLSGRRMLVLLTVRDAGKLIAIAPLAARSRSFVRLAPFGSVEFLGTGSVGSDYLDVIARRGSEMQAWEALADYLLGRKIVMKLSQLKEGSLAARLAAALQREGNWKIVQSKIEICPFINLTGHTWETYLATLGPAHRQNYQRRLRNLTKGFDMRLEPVCVEAERGGVLRKVFELHHRRWNERGGSSAFHSAGLLSFHDELSCLALARGWLRLFVLWLNEKPVACIYGFRYRDVFYFYQSGFDPAYSKQSVGMVLMGLVIRSAIEEGALEYDLLHGSEPYKFLWSRETRDLARLEIYPPNVYGVLHKETVAWVRSVKRMLRQVLPKTMIDRIARARAFGVGEGT
ncbi:MAG: GNAT family N-acetyltransferase [Deltaproteobacteria bacterium]|nr:GNAT family N-acetyltransferase [Deltaproteobacteria bacterium]